MTAQAAHRVPNADTSSWSYTSHYKQDLINRMNDEHLTSIPGSPASCTSSASQCVFTPTSSTAITRAPSPIAQETGQRPAIATGSSLLRASSIAADSARSTALSSTRPGRYVPGVSYGAFDDQIRGIDTAAFNLGRTQWDPDSGKYRQPTREEVAELEARLSAVRSKEWNREEGAPITPRYHLY